jgi:5-methylthioadenosine/S-adenosylhomocysteine deaminase
MDLAIRNTRLVTMADGRPNPIADGAVGVDDGELVYVGPDGDFDGDPAETVDGSDHVTVPGLVDAHVHTRHTLLRGGAQDVPEIQWMDRALGPLARHLDEADRVAGAKLGVLEALHSGVTTMGEYAGEVADLVEAVYRPWGVRVAATETINEVSDERDDVGPGEPYRFDREQGETALQRADALVERYADDPLVEPMYGPQALDMVSLDLLAETFDRAAAADATVHVHVAQGRRERLQIQARYGEDASTVSVLDDEGLLGDRLLAVHCHDAGEGERQRIADSGASYVGCPSSIAAIDGVTPPVEFFREAGAAVGLGTDQAPGPGSHDFRQELRTAAMLAKTDRGDPTALPAWEALGMGTLGGAEALGIDGRVGSLVEGKRADVAMFRVDDPGLAPVVDSPLATAVPNLVHGAASADAVLVDGAFVLRDGALVAGDGDAVVATAQSRAADVFDRAEADWRAAGSDLVERVDEGWL